MCAFCTIFRAEPDFKGLGVGFLTKTPKNLPNKTPKLLILIPFLPPLWAQPGAQPGDRRKDSGVLLKDPGVLLKDPEVLLKDPGVLLKDPGVL